MTLLKNFDETGKEIGSENISINETNFQQFENQYGKDRAEGYLDAVRDILGQLENVFETPERMNSAPIVRTELRKLYKNKQEFLNFIASRVNTDPSMPSSSMM